MNIGRENQCLALILIPAIALLGACAPLLAVKPGATIPPASPAPGDTGGGPTPVPQALVLPPPQLKGTLSLEEALAERRSVRTFSDAALSPSEVGQLLWAAQGVTHPSGLRTAPSAGALYPLEVYAVTGEAVYRYESQEHRLAVHAQGDVRPALHAAALRQDPVLQAPLVIVMAAVYARTAHKYGEERSPRYAHLEAGHAAQNVLLQAVALKLGAVPIGAFEDEQVKQVLGLPSEQQPLYLIPVGHLKGVD